MESPQDQPDPGQTGQEPTPDSGLQTPQPDQPFPPSDVSQVPPEPEQPQTEQPQTEQPPAEAAVQQDESASEPPTQFPSSDEQNSAFLQRERELEEDRRARNVRTGDGEIRDGEVQAQRQEHNVRTGGGDVPVADGVDGSQDSGLGQE